MPGEETVTEYRVTGCAPGMVRCELFEADSLAQAERYLADVEMVGRHIRRARIEYREIGPWQPVEGGDGDGA